jgi:cytochrome oxidase Cu insertion factor (SCO1/SenC/PrrC family)
VRNSNKKGPRIVSNNSTSQVEKEMRSRALSTISTMAQATSRRCWSGILSLLCATTLFCHRTSSYPDAPSHTAADFAVTTETGTRSLKSLAANGIVVIFAGYRGCPDICSHSLRHVATAYESLHPEEKEHTQLVFLEVGSAPPDLAREYALKFHRKFATAVDTGGIIAKDLQLFVAVAEAGPPRRITHAGTIILADHKLQTRKRLPHDIPADDLKNEIQVLLADRTSQK